MKVAFLDRDGTIIRDYPDEEWRYVSSPEFLQNSIHGLKEIVNREYEIIIITNQYLIGEKIITQLQYDLFTTKFIQSLKIQGIKILDIFYCPHDRKSNCKCCKPNTGLIEKAIEKYPAINLKKSFLAGDSLCDMQLAAAFKLKSFSLKTSFGCDETVIADLKELKVFI